MKKQKHIMILHWYKATFVSSTIPPTLQRRLLLQGTIDCPRRRPPQLLSRRAPPSQSAGTFMFCRHRGYLREEKTSIRSIVQSIAYGTPYEKSSRVVASEGGNLASPLLVTLVAVRIGSPIYCCNVEQRDGRVIILKKKSTGKRTFTCRSVGHFAISVSP